MPIAKWKKISQEKFNELVKESHSFRELAEKLGYKKDAGGNIQTVKDAISFYKSDISHFLGQSWNKENFDYSIFEKGTPIKKFSNNTVKALVKIRDHKCESCGLTEWLENPITLHIHHKDGDRTNNGLENLQLLCPNCHSFTDNYIGKKNSGQKEISDNDFIEALKVNRSINATLVQLGMNSSGTAYARARELIHKNQISHLY
jgi:hypothetical protein